MHHHLAQLLSEYGYLAVFVGCLLEGETLLILAGFAAHQGYLSLPLVVLIAACAGALGDLLFYLCGRFAGTRLLARFPALAARAGPLQASLLRHDRLIIVGIRFMYGLRIAGPVIIGASGVSLPRFVTFNLLGAALWAPLITAAGYLFGQAFTSTFSGFKHFEGLAAIALIAAVWGWHGLRRWRRKPKTGEKT